MVVVDPVEPAERTQTVVIGATDCPFSINPSTLAVTVTIPAAFNNENNVELDCIVVITDDNIAPRTTILTVSVNVLDVNEPPVLYPYQRGSILENAAVGSTVIFVAANDTDGPARWNTIRFRLLNLTVFDIEPDSGRMYLRSPELLDFEIMQEYAVMVEVIDVGFLATEE